MAETFGLTSVGLKVKTAAQVREGINARLRGFWGPSFDLSDSSPDGQEIAILSAEIGDAWALLQAVYSSNNRDAATGAALEALLLLTGTLRPEATYSTVDLTLTGADTVVVPSGSRVKNGTGVVTFLTTEDGTITALTAWANTTAYAVDDRRTNAARAYVCITAGTSAGSGGPTTTASDITDGTAHWRYLGEGVGAVDVGARASITGPVLAVSGDLTVIDTPVSGWQSAINLLDADLGRDVATDAEFRALGEADLARPGATTPDAIRETLLAVADVESVTVFYNPTDATDGDGVPPHAVECMVRGGDDQAIFDVLLRACIAAGIASHGTEVGASLDSEGVSHVVKFSRPEEIEIYVAVILEKVAHSADNADSYPIDGDAQVKAAIVAYGDAQLCGKNAVASRLAAAAFTVAGVLDVSDVNIDTAPTPLNSFTIPISSRQLAVYDSSRISVTTSNGTP